MASHRRGLVALLTVVTVMGSLLAPPAGAAGPDDDCPTPMPVSEVRRGMNGTGYTVAEGRNRESFSVEVLGVLADALGPGRDMIVIEASGGEVDEHGIWGGMSGSPVFIGEKLLGAVAFGFSLEPSGIAGVTPAEEMYRVMDYPEGESGATRTATRVRLPRRMRHRIALSARMETNDVASSMTQLPVPVSISGASRPGMDRIDRIVQRENLPLIPYAGAAAATHQTTSGSEMRAGDNLAVAASYGDITFAAVGTATFVCRGRVMAFGHPFFWEGDTAMGSNASSTIAVIDDAFGSYEVATIDELVGSIDQDRFAGVRQVLGLVPHGVPITSSIHAENTDRARDGTTEVMLPEMMPFLGWLHLSGNLLMTMDEYSEGSAALDWAIHGTDADGDAWSLERSNIYSSEWGIADEATFELTNAMNAILFNRFEDVEFTSVNVEGTADDAIEQYTIGSVRVSRDGQQYRDREQVRAQPGDTIYLRLELMPYAGEPETLDMTVQIPAKMKTDASIDITGGGLTFGEEEICIYDPTQCVGPTGKRIETFEDLLESLRDKPHNNDVVATLRGGLRGRVKARSVSSLDQVVKGQAFVYVRIAGSKGGGAVPEGGVVSEGPPIE